MPVDLVRSVWLPAACLSALILSGCSSEGRVESVRISNEQLGPLSIAVAPALNQSGSSDFDPDRFADLMASELSLANDINVIPVSRVLAILSDQGRDGVDSPSHAMELLDLLGADAILVFAVTEYDPYVPPSIGITAQLYGARARQGGFQADPIKLSRSGVLDGEFAPRATRGLLAQVQRVFDASHDTVIQDVKTFARYRRGGRSAFGWRKFLVSQQNYIRFCCNSTISQLLSRPSEMDSRTETRER
ncbi:MAG: hypothetical protein ACPGXK_02100 [Phycisphaerae bacterium]